MKELHVFHPFHRSVFLRWVRLPSVHSRKSFLKIDAWRWRDHRSAGQRGWTAPQAKTEKRVETFNVKSSRAAFWKTTETWQRPSFMVSGSVESGRFRRQHNAFLSQWIFIRSLKASHEHATVKTANCCTRPWSLTNQIRSIDKHSCPNNGSRNAS